MNIGRCYNWMLSEDLISFFGRKWSVIKLILDSGLAHWSRWAYSSFQQKAKRVTQRSDGVDAVMITIPNYMHYPTAKIFLDAGFDVICDKPLTNTIEEASSLGDCAHFLSWRNCEWSGTCRLYALRRRLCSCTSNCLLSVYGYKTIKH